MITSSFPNHPIIHPQEPSSQSPFNNGCQGISSAASAAAGLMMASDHLQQLYSSPSLPNISLGRPHSNIPLTASSLASNSTNSGQSPSGNNNNKASVIQFNESILSKAAAAAAANGGNGGQQFTEMQLRALRLSMAAAAGGGGNSAGNIGGGGGHPGSTSSPPGPFFPTLPGEKKSSPKNKP